METIRIERIAPPSKSRGGRKSLWPFHHLKKIGDTFLVPGTKKLSSQEANRHRVRAAASAWKNRHPDFNYTIQMTADGLRCWRIEAKA